MIQTITAFNVLRHAWRQAALRRRLLFLVAVGMAGLAMMATGHRAVAPSHAIIEASPERSLTPTTKAALSSRPELPRQWRWTIEPRRFDHMFRKTR